MRLTPLAEMFSGKTAEAPATPTEPAPTKEDVRAILAEMSSRGFTAQVKELLRQHGAATLSGIDPTEYAALIKDAEGLRKWVITHCYPRPHPTGG